MVQQELAVALKILSWNKHTIISIHTLLAKASHMTKSKVNGKVYSSQREAMGKAGRKGELRENNTI